MDSDSSEFKYQSRDFRTASSQPKSADKILYGSPPKGRQSLLLGGSMNILCLQVQKEGDL